MIHSQKKPAMEKRPINLGLYLACIKNMMTKEALIKAMTKAMKMLLNLEVMIWVLLFAPLLFGPLRVPSAWSRYPLNVFSQRIFRAWLPLACCPRRLCASLRGFLGRASVGLIMLTTTRTGGLRPRAPRIYSRARVAGRWSC